MNQPSLFSFEESSVWDPKVIRKCLVVSQDQLIKLDSFPGWAKVQDNQDTLRLDKELSIEISQSECSVNVVSNSQRIEKNKDLFNEQVENRLATFQAYKVYENKLTRSLSLYTISESCKNFVNNKTLKRASSFQNLYELSDASNINYQSKNFRRESSSERQFRPDICNRNIPWNKPVGNIKLSSECKISHSEPGKSDELFLSKEINSRTMEVVSQLPATISNPIASLHFETAKVSNDILPAENAVKDVITEPVSVPLHSESSEKSNGVVPVENAATGSDQFIKLNTESMNADLSSKIEKEINGIALTRNLAPHSTDLPDESTKDVNSTTSSSKFNESCITVSSENCKPDSGIVKEVPGNEISASKVSLCSDVSDESVKADNSSSNKCEETHVPVSSETCESGSISVKEVLANVVPVCENPTLHLNVQDQEKILSFNLCNTDEVIPDKSTGSGMISVEKTGLKNDATMTSAKSDGLNLHESCPTKSEVVVSPVKAFYVSEKRAFLENVNLARNCDSDMKEVKLESDQKECDNKTYEPIKSSADNEASSGNNEASSSKKRKLESRNKRSKRLKSDDKQGNIKIRSIKKVGEIYYSVEEVKTMLDIMKRIL